jgi:hypothetical protein
MALHSYLPLLLPECTDLLVLLFADDTAGLTAGPNLNEVLKKANLEYK